MIFFGLYIFIEYDLFNNDGKMEEILKTNNNKWCLKVRMDIVLINNWKWVVRWSSFGFRES